MKMPNRNKLKIILQKYEEELYKTLKKSFNIEDLIAFYWEAIHSAYNISRIDLKQLLISINANEEAIKKAIPTAVKIKDIHNMVWDGNAEKLENRIRAHIHNLYPELKDTDNVPFLDKKTLQALFTLLLRLLENELNYMYNHELVYGLQQSGLDIYFVVNHNDACECESCRDEAAKSEPIRLFGPHTIPPFHPGCECNFIFLTAEERKELGY